MPATPAENRQLLKSAFVNALGLAPDIVVDQLKYQGIAQWDSMAHMVLVQEIETALNVMLSTDDVIGLSSFERAVEILGTHGVDARA
jgi:acyl carrier protein